MIIKLGLIFLFSFAISLFFIRFFIRLAWKYKLGKIHENFSGRKITVSSLGGLGIFLTLFIILIFNFPITQSRIIQGVLIGGVLTFLVGFLDDRIELLPPVKIFFQFLAALILIRFGVRIDITYLPNVLNLVLTVVWIVIITNALNLLDIMDGLCGGLAFIIAFAFFILGFVGNNFFGAAAAICLAGSLLAFLGYNFPPAKIFLGNSGSLFLGFIFSALAISLKYAPEGKYVALLTPMLILALPFYDTFFVMLMRLFKGKSVFLKTKDHLAMRFVAKGYSEKSTLFRMFMLSVVLAAGAILISFTSDLIGLFFLGFLLIFLGILTKKMCTVKVK